MQITLAFVFLILGGLTFYWVRSRHLAYLAEAKRLNDEFEAGFGVCPVVHGASGGRIKYGLGLGGDAARGVTAHRLVNGGDADGHDDGSDAGEEQGEAGPGAHLAAAIARAVVGEDGARAKVVPEHGRVVPGASGVDDADLGADDHARAFPRLRNVAEPKRRRLGG